MKSSMEFPFEKARRITAGEVALYRSALERKSGVKRPIRGRPTKILSERYQPVSIRIHPKILEWAKAEAKKRGLGYQTLINQVLLKYAA